LNIFVNKKNIKYILAVLIFINPLYVLAASGMLIIANEKTDTYILLVRDHTRQYFEMLAGNPEPGKSLTDSSSREESSYEAALRESVEETRGYLGRQQLQAASCESDFVNDNGFIFYRANLVKFNLDEVRLILIPNSDNWTPMREISEYAWVNVKEILDSNGLIVLENTGKKIIIHKKLKAGIEKAKAKNWF
jgi:8-oxo-dGTP pyrophosphatase MutT (NUDIX family)